MALISLFFAVLFAIGANRERMAAQTGKEQAMSWQAVYLDQKSTAEKRALKAETRVEYLEDLLLRRFQIEVPAAPREPMTMKLVEPAAK